MIGELMAEASFGPRELQLIAVTLGPGTFTGSRIGMAAARALALATGARLVGLTSLEVMAWTAAAELGPLTPGRDLAVAVDAKRDQVYFQLFDSDLHALTEPLAINPVNARLHLRERETLVAGTGARLVQAHASALVEVALPRLQPDARAIDSLLALASAREPRPFYLRPPDAKPQGDKSLARVT